MNVGLLKFLNATLGPLNWVVVPVKVALFLVAGLITRILEPYEEAGFLPKLGLRGYLDKLETRLATTFRWYGYTLCEFSGDVPNGSNQYVGDWCLWEGVYTATRFWRSQNEGNDELKRYLTSWIATVGGKTMLARGMNATSKAYDVSVDQAAGLAFALAQAGTVDGANALILRRFLEDTIAAGGLLAPEGYDADRDLRFGLMASGCSIALHAFFLRLMMELGGGWRYRLRYWFLIAQGLPLMLAMPITKLPNELVPGFDFNITILALAALSRRYGSWSAKVGLRWCLWLQEMNYNPWWALVVDRETKLDNAYVERCIDHLKTFDDGNLDDWMLTDHYPTVKWWRWWGLPVLAALPPVNFKRGDCFLWQGVWRGADDYGFKNMTLRATPRRFNGLAFIAPAMLALQREER